MRDQPHIIAIAYCLCTDESLSTSSVVVTTNHPQPTLPNSGLDTEGMFCMCCGHNEEYITGNRPLLPLCIFVAIILLVYIDAPLSTSSTATTANDPQLTLTSTEGLYVLLVHLAIYGLAV